MRRTGRYLFTSESVTEGHPEGLPCSELVARLASMLDGKATVEDLFNALAANLHPPQQQQLLSSVLSTLHILYVDGTIAEL